MATLGTKTILINSISDWGILTGDAATLKIPGYGEFAVADMINVNASRGAAATKPVFRYTVAGAAPGEDSTLNFVVNYVTDREAAQWVRMSMNQGAKYAVSIPVKDDAVADVAAAIRAAFTGRRDYADLPFTVGGTGANVDLTLKDENAQIRNGNTGYLGAPYVESYVTGKQVISYTAALSTVTGFVPALGLGKDIEEDAFLATSFSVAPYAEKITDRPIDAGLYAQFYFEIPKAERHEIQGSFDAVKGTTSYCVYVNEDVVQDIYEVLNAIAAKGSANHGWSAIAAPV